MEQKENRKRLRLKLTNPLRVLASSIGAPLQYDLVTHDISISGFFLNFEYPLRFPFTSSSIIEICLIIDQDNKIDFLGRIARIVHANDPESDLRKGIAVSIIQIDADAKESLKKFVEHYQELANKVDYKIDNKVDDNNKNISNLSSSNVA